MKIHPDKTLEALKAKKPRAGAKLDILHDVCREIYNTPGDAGRKDYSPGSVGRKAQERKGPSLNTMYSPLGAHFRELLDAWATWDGADTQKPAKVVVPRSGVEDLLRRISDPALRSLIGFELARGKQALAELNALKGQTKLVVNVRPADGTSRAQNQAVQVVSPVSMLLPSERDALNQACDDEKLKKIGFVIGANGSVKWPTRKGVDEIVFPIGFLTGLRKLLG